MLRILNNISYIILVLLYLGLANGQDATPAKQSEAKPQVSETQSQTKQSITESIQNEKPDIQWKISFAKIFWSLVIFLIAFVSIKYLTKILETLGERWTNVRLLIKRMIPIIRITGWTFVLYIIIAGVFAPPIETLIAVTASAGIAVGFASQDILKNIFGGIMILFDRPFQVGDKIAIGNYYGEVVQIGLRSVRIVTADDSLISIPNSDLVNQAVSNSNSGEFNCQVVAEFYLPAHINLERLKKIAYLAAACSKYIYLNKPIAIILKNEIQEGRSLLKMRLKAYVLDLRYEFAFASEMTELVIKQLMDESLVHSEELLLFPTSH
jgi:MscS family membrane protein